MKARALEKPFVSKYRSMHWKTNPESVEEYLRTIERGKVCVSAFYFVVNEAWGHDWWNRIQKEFDEYYDAHLYLLPIQKEWWQLEDVYKNLCFNWDAKECYKREKKSETRERLGIYDIPEYAAWVNKKSEEAIAEVRAKAQRELSPQPKTEEPKVEEPKDEADNDEGIDFTLNEHNNDFDALFGAEDVDVEIKYKSRVVLKDDKMSINLRKNRGRITINQKISEDIRTRGGYEYVALKKNKDGEVFLFFNDNNGVTYTEGGRDKHENISISKSPFVLKIAELLGINDEYVVVNIKQVAQTDEYVAYKVFI